MRPVLRAAAKLMGCEMDEERWRKVNDLEKLWWQRWKARTDMAKVRDELIERAKSIEGILKKYLHGESSKILQIGPAANGEVYFLKGQRFAIDPLASFFKANFPELIDTDVQFVEGVGENVPYPDNFFDALLILNVLDHCSDPEKVLGEIFRSLKGGGVLVLGLNVYKTFASLLHRLFGFIDREHPHAITLGHLRRSFRDRFALLEEKFVESDLPKHDLLKRGILFVLKSLDLAPTYYQVVARKL
jgi:SAM-dependent methyltransferase